MKPLCIGQDDVLLAAVQNRIMNKRGFILELVCGTSDLQYFYCVKDIEA